jgi:hypothetical protein
MVTVPPDKNVTYVNIYERVCPALYCRKNAAQFLQRSKIMLHLVPAQ